MRFPHRLNNQVSERPKETFSFVRRVIEKNGFVRRVPSVLPFRSPHRHLPCVVSQVQTTSDVTPGSGPDGVSYVFWTGWGVLERQVSPFAVRCYTYEVHSFVYNCKAFSLKNPSPFFVFLVYQTKICVEN